MFQLHFCLLWRGLGEVMQDENAKMSRAGERGDCSKGTGRTECIRRLHKTTGPQEKAISARTQQAFRSHWQSRRRKSLLSYAQDSQCARTIGLHPDGARHCVLKSIDREALESGCLPELGVHESLHGVLVKCLRLGGMGTE